MRFTDGSGLASLEYLAATGTDAVGSPLTIGVTIDDYVEQASRPKTVGPTWQQLGFTPAGIHAVISSTGEFS